MGLLNRDETTAHAQSAETAQGHTWHHRRGRKPTWRLTAEPIRTKQKAPKATVNRHKSEWLEACLYIPIRPGAKADTQ